MGDSPPQGSRRRGDGKYWEPGGVGVEARSMRKDGTMAGMPCLGLRLPVNTHWEVLFDTSQRVFKDGTWQWEDCQDPRVGGGGKRNGRIWHDTAQQEAPKNSWKSLTCLFSLHLAMCVRFCAE